MENVHFFCLSVIPRTDSARIYQRTSTVTVMIVLAEILHQLRSVVSVSTIFT